MVGDSEICTFAKHAPIRDRTTAVRFAQITNISRQDETRRIAHRAATSMRRFS